MEKPLCFRRKVVVLCVVFLVYFLFSVGNVSLIIMPGTRGEKNVPSRMRTVGIREPDE